MLSRLTMELFGLWSEVRRSTCYRQMSMFSKGQWKSATRRNRLTRRIAIHMQDDGKRSCPTPRSVVESIAIASAEDLEDRGLKEVSPITIPLTRQGDFDLECRSF